jgi:demethylmenaquinone methyltransferase/2-methoxy-6-polyprenyl-1,4-benzoquinol methylase
MMKRRSREHLLESHKKRSYNRWLFGIVAKRYNIVTYVLSFGRDSFWKKWLVSRIPVCDSPRVIDIASGNGDLAFALAKRYPDAIVACTDITPAMLALGRSRHGPVRVAFSLQDMQHLAFRAGEADIVTGGYALRNAPDLEKTLHEVRRVLKAGGTAAFLDFSKPSVAVAAFVEYALLKFWGGLWGLLLHGRPEIYAYIAESLRVFPDRPSLHALLARHGLPVTQSKLFFFGVMEAIVCTAAGPLSETRGTHPRNR